MSLPPFLHTCKEEQTEGIAAEAVHHSLQDAFLQGFLSASFDALALIEDGCILAANTRCASLFGESVELLHNRPILDLIATEDRERFLRHLESCQNEPVEYLACRKDGALFIAEARVTRLPQDARRVRLVAFRDKTSSKLTQLIAESHLNELEYLSRTAIEFLRRMPIGTVYQYICDQVSSLAGTAIVAISTFDREAEAFLVQAVSGPEANLIELKDAIGDTLIGREFPASRDTFSQTHPGELLKVSEGLYSALLGNVPVDRSAEIEARLHIHALYQFPIHLDGILHGLVVIAMIGQVTPQRPYLITAFLNQAGIALQRCQTESELERERAYLATAIDMLPIPLTFLAPDQQVQRRNLAMQALLEKLNLPSEAALTYHDPITMLPIHADCYPHARALNHEVTIGHEFLLEGVHQDKVPIIVHAAPIQFDGKVLATVSAIEDITALKEADRVKDEFLAILSHELKTPLTCILGWSEIGQIRSEPGIIQQALEIVHRNARRQQLLINELLDVSRLMYRRMDISPQRLDLWVELRDAIENIQLEAERRHLTVTVLPPDHSLPVYADSARLQQCLGNILHNSLKFTPAGGSVTVICSQEQDWAVVKVIDTGRGMSPEISAQLFRPFVQARRDELEGGLGLGLALVHGIMALHHGDVSAESPGEGKGSTFTLRLPIDTTSEKPA